MRTASMKPHLTMWRGRWVCYSLRGAATGTTVREVCAKYAAKVTP